MYTKLTLATIICFILTCLPYQADGQALNERLAQKEGLIEIMETVDSYYDSLSNLGIDRLPGDTKLKHWKRYEWYMSSRLGPNNEFVSIPDSLLKAKRVLQRQQRQADKQRSTLSFWNFLGPTSSPYAGNGNWELFNGIGRVDRIAFHPSDANTIYVGTPAGGIWRTTNGGGSWTPLDDYLPSLGVSGLVVSRTNPNLILALSGDGDSQIPGGLVAGMGYARPSVGILRSIDGGNTWTRPANNTTGVPYDLVQSPSNANILLAATGSGVYRSVNAGASWQIERSGQFFAVAFHPTDGTKAYAAGNNRVWYSDDSGDSWDEGSFDITPLGNDRLALAVTPAEPGSVYLLAGRDATAGQFDGFYKSEDDGQTYDRVTNSPNLLGSAEDGSDNNAFNFYIHNIAVSPTDPDVVVTACLIGFISTDGGSNWNNLTTWDEFPDATRYVHPDMHDIAFNPLDNALYIASDGGLYKSTDLGTTWTSIGEGIRTTQFYSMTPHPTQNYTLAGGTQDNGYKLRQNNSGIFEHFDCCDGFDFAFSSQDGIMYSSINGGINRYNNFGATRSSITPPGLGEFFKPVTAHANLPQTLYVGSANVWRSDNTGNDWTNTGATGSWCIEACIENSNMVYAAGSANGGFGADTDGQLWRSDFLGASWTRLDQNPGFPFNFNKITDIATNPTNSDEVAACFGGFIAGNRIVHSTDAGATWTNISGSLPNIPVNCAAISSNGHIYIGTDIGVFFKTPSMDDWIPYSNFLPNVPVTTLAINEELNVIRAATFGRGIWQATLSDGNCVENLAWNISIAQSGSKYYEANNSILNNVNITVSGGISTDVTWRAGNFIDLKPGFLSKGDGAAFLAEIGACLDGGVPD